MRGQMWHTLLEDGMFVSAELFGENLDDAQQLFDRNATCNGALLQLRAPFPEKSRARGISRRDESAALLALQVGDGFRRTQPPLQLRIRVCACVPAALAWYHELAFRGCVKMSTAACCFLAGAPLKVAVV